MPATKSGNPVSEISGPHLVQVGYQQISSATLAASTPLTVPDDAVEALIQCNGGVVRWRADDTDPTATVGNRINDGDSITIRGLRALRNFKAILSSSTPILDISYWG